MCFDDLGGFHQFDRRLLTATLLTTKNNLKGECNLDDNLFSNLASMVTAGGGASLLRPLALLCVRAIAHADER